MNIDYQEVGKSFEALSTEDKKSFLIKLKWITKNLHDTTLDGCIEKLEEKIRHG
jgi:hypothetical protein